MAFLSKRTSHGHAYWSICESRRINGKPRNIILEYLGSAETILNRLQDNNSFAIKSYSHGDTFALLQTAFELDIISIINKYIPKNKKSKKQKRDNISVGASILLAAIGRACHPTSKLGWYEWCEQTSLEYSLKESLNNLDSQHFWDQMDCVPIESIPKIEEDIITNAIKKNNIRPELLFYDTTNFFTFIDSTNTNCSIPQRGHNKQKRNDLRQIGLALLVTQKEQLPLFHKTYSGNQNDQISFQSLFHEIVSRFQNISLELSGLTLVFDKGNNSKQNFKLLDDNDALGYVAGLVPSHFKKLIKEANKNFSTITIDNEEVPVYRIKRTVWGQERTCVVTISKQLKEGQIRGIHQHLQKKYRDLEKLKHQLENPKRRKSYQKEDVEKRLKKIIRGQFIENILKYTFIEFQKDNYSFTYHLDRSAFDNLKNTVLGRKIVVTNRQDWSSEDILKAYRGQSHVEGVFRNLKNPFHSAVRPQYHWTDQKIQVHIFSCLIGYILTSITYLNAQKKAKYKRNISHFMDDLRKIRLACIVKGKRKKKVIYQLEEMPKKLKKIAKALNITNDNLRFKYNICDYTS